MATNSKKGIKLVGKRMGNHANSTICLCLIAGRDRSAGLGPPDNQSAGAGTGQRSNADLQATGWANQSVCTVTGGRNEQSLCDLNFSEFHSPDEDFVSQRRSG